MKATFLERKLQAIELLAQVDNDNLLTLIEQLLWDWANLEIERLSMGLPEDEFGENDLPEIWSGRYEA